MSEGVLMNGHKLHDVIILGGGPAGLAAGIYAGRARMETLLLDSMGGGGQMNIIDTIENYPGFAEPLTGLDLVSAMRDQMENFGVEVTFDQAESITVSPDGVRVVGGEGTYCGRTLLVASGATHRNLGVEGERRLTGRGVSYCATCDGPFFKGQHVAVVGGGDTAIKEANYLAHVVDKVTVIHRRNKLRAEMVMQEKALANPKINFLWDSVVEEIVGESTMEGLRVRNVLTGQVDMVPAKGVFIFIGILPNSNLLKGQVELDMGGFIKTDIHMRTSHPRIFAAGDVRTGSVRQIATAVGDGVTAILKVHEILDIETPPRELPQSCSLAAEVGSGESLDIN